MISVCRGLHALKSLLSERNLAVILILKHDQTFQVQLRPLISCNSVVCQQQLLLRFKDTVFRLPQSHSPAALSLLLYVLDILSGAFCTHHCWLLHSRLTVLLLCWTLTKPMSLAQTALLICCWYVA